MYANNNNSIGYEIKSIIEQLEEISRVDCFLKCTRRDSCNHVVLSESERRCKLLKAVVRLSGPNAEDKSEEGGKIYDLVGEFLCYTNEFLLIGYTLY